MAIYDEILNGRPRKFETVEELRKQIAIYFWDCDHNMTRMGKIVVHNPRPYTISGLAYALGTNRMTLLNYEDSDYHKNTPEAIRQEFIYTINRTKEWIRTYTEERSFEKGIAVGVIFNLKNNWGFKDKSEVENTIKGLSLKELSDAAKQKTEDEKTLDSKGEPMAQDTTGADNAQPTQGTESISSPSNGEDVVRQEGSAPRSESADKAE